MMTQTQNVLAWLRQLSDLDSAGSRLDKKARELADITRQMDSLRERLPTAILRHYDQRKARGKPCVVEVKSGICGGCHLSLPSGRVSELRRMDGTLNVCDNCGAFIFQGYEEPQAEPAAEAISRPARRISTTAPKKQNSVP